MAGWYIHVDGNSFYASCEKVFRPDLADKAVVVFSNNDGCIIARSPEAKALDIKMGSPKYMVQDILDKGEMIGFSSNYTLYGDMSRRMMNIVADMVAKQEIYSIDECFGWLYPMPEGELLRLGLEVRRRVLQWIKIPVGVGIGTTKTLAKIANKMSRHEPGKVLVLDSDEKRIEYLKKLAIQDVWGVGRQHANRLKPHGIVSAWDFTQLPREWVKKNMSVVGERLWYELNGICCLEMLPPRATSKNICTSRSFGKMMTEYEPISEAVATHAHRCAEQLRQQDAFALIINVFLETNRFRPDLPQYNPSYTINLPVASHASPDLVKAAIHSLKWIFKAGYQYQKAGVIVSGLVPAETMQGDLFIDEETRKKQNTASAAMDKLNRIYGKDVVRTAAQGYAKQWRLRADFLSPCPTTKWGDVMKVSG